ncbi:META domain-containing protein [Salinibacter altiplanensis]|uniref:META domain-containing protein n=1 Tax=Salinibacter altiplanensis TaxID=1803181 RepID=UPI000C9FA8B7|nr:META domain-containing protein [Salinibacter altiplanensis]
MRSVVALLITGLCSLTFVNCDPVGDLFTQDGEAVPTSLRGTAWRLTTLVETNDTTHIRRDSLSRGAHYTVSFMSTPADSCFSSRSGHCLTFSAHPNSGSATYTVEGQNLSVSELQTTFMGRPPDSKEPEFLGVLRSGPSYRIDGETLQLRSDSTTLMLEPDSTK